MSKAAAFANRLWLVAAGPGDRRLRDALPQCEAVQRAGLAACLARNAGTVFGRTHDFAGIRSARDYRAKVPVMEGSALAGVVERIGRGEGGILTRDRVTHFALTAGTDAPSRMVPYTARLQAEFRAAVAPWVVDAFARWPGLKDGPAWWSVSPPLGRRWSEAGIPIGFEEDAAYLGGLSQRLVGAAMAVPGWAGQIMTAETSFRVTAAALVGQPGLRLISVWHPGYLDLVCDWIAAHWDEVRTDVAKGLEMSGHRLPPGHLAPGARPDQPATLWPKLALISAWGDGHAALALEGLARSFPGTPVQPKGVIATEAFLTLPYSGTYPLALNSHFFEFQREDGTLLFAWELTQGEVVEPIVTTGGGLYRYRIPDLLEVTGHLATTPTFRLLGRSGGGSDLVGEKLAERFVADCLGAVLPPGMGPFALLAPTETRHYTAFIQADAPLPESLARDLDGLLRRNPHYDLARARGQLECVLVRRVGPGATTDYLARMAAERGQKIGDIKPLALSPLPGWEVWLPLVPDEGGHR